MFPERPSRRRPAPSAHPAVAEAVERRVLLAAVVPFDVVTSPAGSGPAEFTGVNETLFFAATTPSTGRELFKTDGTAAGTTLIKDVVSGSEGSDPRALMNVGGTVFFTTGTGEFRKELWKSDGTAAGTVRVKVGPTDFFNTPFGSLTDVSGTVYFVAIIENNRTELWKSDPGAVGGVRVSDRVNLWTDWTPVIEPLAAYKGNVYFRAKGPDGAGMELWRSDGTDAGTVRVRDINPGAADSKPSGLTVAGEFLYFAADDGTHGVELWRTDGTEAGAVMVRDLEPGPTSSAPLPVADVGGNLLFVAGGNRALWRSDGTESGTSLLAGGVNTNFRIGTRQRRDGKLYFSITDTNVVWVSDGTPAGTHAIHVGSGGVRALTQADGELYVVIRSGMVDELWTIGRATDTPLRLASFPDGLSPRFSERLITAVGRRAFFRVRRANVGTEVWQSDGTLAGTRPVNGIALGPDMVDAWDIGALSGVAYFGAPTPTAGIELWRSDATDAGTYVLADLAPGTADSYTENHADFNSTLYFSSSGDTLFHVNPAQDGVSGFVPPNVTRGRALFDFTPSGPYLYYSLIEAAPNPIGPLLVRSDGTPGGTDEVGPGTDYVDFITDLDGRGTVLFSGLAFGIELMRAGAAGDASLVKDIYPGYQSSSPADLVNRDGMIFFSADDGSSGRELWKSDGTEAGTVRVKDIVAGPVGSNPHGLVVVGNQVIFRTSPAAGVTELWKSDGTDAGTVRVARIGDAPVTPRWPRGGGDPARGAALGDILLFAAADPAAGAGANVELWRSDGTEFGTFRLKDIEPGTGSSDPRWFAPYAGKVYFNAFDSAGGRELWATDGTEAGTARVDDLFPGPLNSDPTWLTVSGGALWFSGVSPLYGRELWKYTPDPTVVTGRRIFYNNSLADRRGGDDAAVAPDKTPLLPGQRARFRNVTHYSRGINGVMIDLDRLPFGATLTADDIDLAVGDGSAWKDLGIKPGVTVHPRPPRFGGTRVAMTLPDGTVKNTWLRVTLKATADTGLATPDTFYVGNLIGDTGASFGAAQFVDGVDLARTRARLGYANNVAPDPCDFNHDGVVDRTDLLLARLNLGRRLALFDAPAAPSPL
jgi:ELWxxDGT repeat protein